MNNEAGLVRSSFFSIQSVESYLRLSYPKVSFSNVGLHSSGITVPLILPLQHLRFQGAHEFLDLHKLFSPARGLISGYLLRLSPLISGKSQVRTFHV